LEKALEKGYRILQVHEVWHFPQSSDGLFKEYVDTFLKIKQESSGYPKNCTTEEQRQQYVDEYLAVEGIQLDRSKIEHNPGMRALSKLMLNSFWGMYFKQCMLFQTFFRWHPNRWKVIATNIHNIYFFFIGKFAQRPNMTKVELISDVQTFLDYLTSDEINILDAN
jgi:hypothetical protein